jgi:hypothetical protein
MISNLILTRIPHTKNFPQKGGDTALRYEVDQYYQLYQLSQSSGLR